eukprot:6431266-Lingulodinium_polyedra.AAC.1
MAVAVRGGAEVADVGLVDVCEPRVVSQRRQVCRDAQFLWRPRAMHTLSVAQFCCAPAVQSTRRGSSLKPS